MRWIRDQTAGIEGEEQCATHRLKGRVDDLTGRDPGLKALAKDARVPAKEPSGEHKRDAARFQPGFTDGELRGFGADANDIFDEIRRHLISISGRSKRDLGDPAVGGRRQPPATRQGM